MEAQLLEERLVPEKRKKNKERDGSVGRKEEHRLEVESVCKVLYYPIVTIYGRLVALCLLGQMAKKVFSTRWKF
jgi:hypothetical protein